MKMKIRLIISQLLQVLLFIYLFITIIIIIISVLRQSLFLSTLKRGLDVTNNYVGFDFGFGRWPLIFRVECPANSVVFCSLVRQWIRLESKTTTLRNQRADSKAYLSLQSYQVSGRLGSYFSRLLRHAQVQWVYSGYHDRTGLQVYIKHHHSFSALGQVLGT